MPWKFFTALGEEKQISAPASDVSFGGYKATLLGNPTGAQDAATKAYVDQQDAVQANYEGVSDFSATAGTYTIPNGSFGTPGWYAPLIVGPNQVWECIGTAPLQCVTAVHLISARMGIRDNAGAAVSGTVYAAGRNPVIQVTPPVITSVHVITTMMRLFTDATVPANTTIRLVQEFQGTGANGRVIRDGTYYQSWAWRRV